MGSVGDPLGWGPPPALQYRYVTADRDDPARPEFASRAIEAAVDLKALAVQHPLFAKTWLQDFSVDEIQFPPTEVPVPKYRGVSHQAAFYASILPSIGLAALALHQDNDTLFPVISFSIVQIFMFLTSGVLHRGPPFFSSLSADRQEWPKSISTTLLKLDHSMIFLNIVGVAAGLGALVCHGPERDQLVHVASAGAAVGIAMEVLFTEDIPKWLDSVIAAGLGIYLGLLVLPSLMELNPHDLFLFWTGSAFYIGGAVVYGKQSPNPAPGLFEFHEVFHLLHILGVVTYYELMYSLIFWWRVACFGTLHRDGIRDEDQQTAFITEDIGFAPLFTLDNAALPIRVEANNILFSTLELLINPYSPATEWMDSSNSAFPSLRICTPHAAIW
ncbi:hypothetical protein CYMTET_27403 [Cymbomonas tetramitiformis]|uniref:Uncharacterized protein n=1 Tax=Cymbomonas tetramitiformis TaxID=36881 RepID=A0AAE0FQ53_9CHLO|nr:hypothetical protein CYMTET_27403 [Cymbomonas tetramitiformis]